MKKWRHIAWICIISADLHKASIDVRECLWKVYVVGYLTKKNCVSVTMYFACVFATCVYLWKIMYVRFWCVSKRERVRMCEIMSVCVCVCVLVFQNHSKSCYQSNVAAQTDDVIDSILFSSLPPPTTSVFYKRCNSWIETIERVGEEQ